MKTFAHRVTEALQGISSHVIGVGIGLQSDKATWRVDWDQQQSQSDMDAVISYLASVTSDTFQGAAVDTAELRADAITLVNVDTSNFGKAYRSIATVLLDEINDLRGWIVDFKAAVAGASTLAQLKTAVAALPNMPDRTLVQAKTAIQNAINGGGVD